MATYRTAELKIDLDKHEKRIGTLERKTDVHDEQIKQICQDVEKHEKWREDINKIIDKIDLFTGIGKWVLLVFGGYVMLLSSY